MIADIFTLKDGTRMTGQQIVEMTRQAVKDGKITDGKGWGDCQIDAERLQAAGLIEVKDYFWAQG